MQAVGQPEPARRGGDPLAAARERARRELSPGRFRHVLGVEETAAALAARYGEDPARARRAALLHDLARELPGTELLARAAGWGLPVGEVEEAFPVLLHGPVAAEIARRELGETDEEVLAAVRSHTTGRAGMGRLERVLFVADLVEPGRSWPGVEAVRAVAAEDLDRACLEAVAATVAYVVARRLPLHPATVGAYNALLQELGDGSAAPGSTPSGGRE